MIKNIDLDAIAPRLGTTVRFRNSGKVLVVEGIVNGSPIPCPEGSFYVPVFTAGTKTIYVHSTNLLPEPQEVA